MGNKIITEKDFWRCSSGAVPAQLQGTSLGTKKVSGEKFITVEDKATNSCIDFGCTKYMLLAAIAAAAVVVVAAIVGVLTVATGGAALIFIGAVAGLAGAAIGAVVGALLCGQMVASKRQWDKSKSDMIVQGRYAITGDHKMICPVGGTITFDPEIKSWSQALALGFANYTGKLMEGMMAGAAVGMGGALLSGGATAFMSGGLRGVGQAAWQFARSMPRNFVVNAVESFSKVGLALRGVMGAQNTAATYGETGSAGVGDFFWGTVAMETGAYDSARNIATGQGTWQDYVGMAMMVAPVGQGKRDLEDALSNKADDAEGKKMDEEEGNTRTRSQEGDAPKQEGEAEAYEAGNNKPSYDELGSKEPCFLAGTLVKTPSGSIEIEKIKVGAKVLVYDFQKNCVRQKPVVKLYTNWTNRYFNIKTSAGEYILPTSKHLFWVENLRKWMPAKELEAGMILKTALNDRSVIESISEYRNVELPTYNLEVEGIHNYFVGAFGNLVHNQNKPSLFESTTRQPTEIYEVYDARTGETVYVGQTTQGTRNRFEQHISEGQREGNFKADWGDRTKFDVRTVETGNWTPYEAHAWEQHYIEKNGGVENLLNKKNAITEGKYDKFADLHNPC